MSHSCNPLTDNKMNELLIDETMIIRDLMLSLKGDELQPMLIILLEGEPFERVIVPLSAIEGLDKHELMFRVGRVAAKKFNNIAGAIFVAEAWSKEVSQAEVWRARQSGFPRPSTCPDRVEIVSITIRSRDGRGMVAMSKIAGEGDSRRPSEWKIISPEDYAKSEDNMLGEFFRGYGS